MKFWKKQYEGMEFVKHYRAHLSSQSAEANGKAPWWLWLKRLSSPEFVGKIKNALRVCGARSTADKFRFGVSHGDGPVWHHRPFPEMKGSYDHWTGCGLDWVGKR